MRRFHSWLAPLAAVFVMGAPGTRARAAPGDEAVRAAPGDEAERARVLYTQGSERYSAGDYVEAARLFLAAFDASQAPALLFNVAQAYRMQGPGACEEALSFYERYRDEDRTLPNRAELQERIAEMRGCALAKRQAVKVAPPATVATPSVSAAPRSGSWGAPALTATGVVVAGAGVGLYFAARAQYDRAAETAPHPSGTYDGWQTATYASYALMAAGGVAAAAGVSWWILRRDEGHAVSARLLVSPDGVLVAGRF